MSKAKKESFFWTSYSDLMTSLFFVMLVLFVLTIVLMRNAMMDNIRLVEELKAKTAQLDSILRATQAQLDKIKEIEESVQTIDARYFGYNADFKRHTLNNISVEFKTGSSNIMDLSDATRNSLKQAGRAIVDFVNTAVAKNKDVKYLLIVEGQSSNDHYPRNFELSYERSLALFKFWKGNNIIFNPNYCEVIISGSGTASPFRVAPDVAGNKANQRFVIHIIPKIGVIQKELIE